MAMFTCANREARSVLFPRAASFLHSHATSFGYKKVPEEDKRKLVGDVFSSVASNYDLMNDIMTCGVHRLWKDRLVSKLHPFPGMKHIDVAGGTGDVAFRVLESVKNVSRRALQDGLAGVEDDTQIFICDINPNMLNVGKKHAVERGLGEDCSLHWVEGDAEALSFEEGSMDGYTIAFGIRNVTHIERALSEAYRVLKRGGRFLCLELSHVNHPVFKPLYDSFSFSVIPALGKLVTGDRESYQYLVESIRKFPTQISDAHRRARGLLSRLVRGYSTNGRECKDITESGFSQRYFTQEPLAGTVQLYDRHVFLCYKTPDAWPPNVDAAGIEELPGFLSKALKARKEDMKKKTTLTICKGGDGIDPSTADVLIFPDMIRYKQLKDDVDNFVEEVLVKNSKGLSGEFEMLSGSYVFVCAHGNRDQRCGVCGPVLVKKFEEEIIAHSLQGQAFVSPCSHIGGHKYAGNVVIFSPHIDGKVTGHWYGYVTPDDVPILLEQHIQKGQIVNRLWRGQMGLSKEDQKRAHHLRTQPSSGEMEEQDAK